MADYDSSLPIRSEADGTDERVLTKIQDGADPGGADKTAEVSEKLVHTRSHGEDPSGTKRQLKLSEAGKANTDGDYDAGDNTEPSSTGMIAHTRSATKDETQQNERPTAVQGDNDKTAMDVAISDSDGNHFSESNPLPVYMSENPGTEVDEFDQTTDTAADASADHDYTVVSTMKEIEAHCAASGKAKFELKVETGVGAGTYDTVAVGFNSTSNPNVRLWYKKTVSTAGVNVRITKTNLDNQPQDLYSEIKGLDI